MENGTILISNVNIVLPDRILENGWLLVQDGNIAAYGDHSAAAPVSESEVMQQDGQNGYVVPGFIDIHVHGGGRGDFMTAKEEELNAITALHMKHGTTAMLATTVTAGKDELTEVIDTIATYQSKPMPNTRIVGVHLEGPFVNPKWKGAQNESYMVAPQIEWLEEWVKAYPGIVKMQTLAPEIDGALPYIAALKENGIVAACGHTDAVYSEIDKAVEHGLSHAVHTFNAMRGLHHREPGTVGAVLTNPNITAEIIADGEHVNPVAIKVLIQSKGADGVVLITDAMEAAGMPDGDYMLGELPVIVENSVARLKDGGSLAGSTLTMIRGFKYLIQEVGVSLIDASRMASLNPARVIGIEESYGSIEAGKRADILILDQQLNVKSVMIGGQWKSLN